MLNKTNRILCIKESKVDFLTILKMKIYMFFNKNCKIAFDMKSVNNIKESFLNFIKQKSQNQKISLFNLNAEIIALLDIINYDKYVYIYNDESDFINNTHSIVNRQFKVF